MYNRLLFNHIENQLFRQKVTLLLGARRVGKTALLEAIHEKMGNKSLWLNGEDADVHKLLEDRAIANYKRILQGYELLIIDEAQFVPDMGRKAKLMIDEIKPLHIISPFRNCFNIY